MNVKKYSWIWPYLLTVSYTHLDVYKRQTLYGQKAPVCVELADGQTEYFCLPDVPSQREV